MLHSRTLGIVFRAILILSFLLIPPAAPVSAQDPTPPPPPADDAQIVRDEETGRVRFMSAGSTPLFSPPGSAGALKSTDVAFEFLKTIGSGFGLSDPANELTVMTAQQEEDGREFLRLQQRYQGVPVVGGELIIQLNPDGAVLSAAGEVATGLGFGVEPAINADTARQLAVEAVLQNDPMAGLTAELLTTSEPELWVYDSSLVETLREPVQALTWKVIVSTTIEKPADLATIPPVHQVLYLSAADGSIVFEYSDVKEAMRRRVINCADSTDCYLYFEDGRGLFQHPTSGPAAENESEQLRNYMAYFYDFYAKIHARKSYDNRDSMLTGWAALYDRDGDMVEGGFSQNAMWFNNQIFFAPGLVTKDIVVHELTHGVTEYTSKLIYYDQSGAINEAFSDLWGEFVDHYVDAYGDRAYPAMLNPYEDTNELGWEVADGYMFDPSRSGGESGDSGPFRKLDDPTVNPIPGPDSLDSSYYYCGFNDNAGVHTNSTVGGYAGYLIANGTNNGDGNDLYGIGIRKTARLFYEVQTRLLTSAASYQDLYYALQQAATNLKFDAREKETVRRISSFTDMHAVPCYGQRGFLAPAATRVISPIGTLPAGDPNIAPAVNLTWRRKGDATSYRVEVRPSSGPVVTAIVKDTGSESCGSGASCYYRLPLKYGLRYTWRVQTINAVGEGPWSPSAVFTLPYANGTVTTQKFMPQDFLPMPLDAARPEFSWMHYQAHTDYVLKIAKVTNDPVNPAIEIRTPVYSGVFNAGKYCTTDECRAVISKSLAPDSVYEWVVLGKSGSLTAPESNEEHWRFSTGSRPTAPDMTHFSATDELMPTLTWQIDPDNPAKKFVLTITGPAGRVAQTVERNTACGSGDCSTKLTRNLDGGTHSLVIQAVNDFGSISGAKVLFSISAPDAAPTLRDVEGDKNRPTFLWSESPRATFYILSAKSSVGTYSANIPASVCSGGLCSFRAGATLKQGDWSYTLQPKNKAGANPAALASGNFTTGAVRLPPKAPTLVAPQHNASWGTNPNVPPAFPLVLQFSPSSLEPRTDEFLLTLTRNGKPVFAPLYLDEAANCAPADPVICTYTLPALPIGKYVWNVTALNGGVVGGKSPNFTFSIVADMPALTPDTQVMEGAEVDYYQAEARWWKQTYAYQYRLTLLRTGATRDTTLYAKTFNTDTICKSDACEWSLPAGMSAGSYKAIITPIAGGLAGIPLTLPFEVKLVTDENLTTNSDGWDYSPAENWTFGSGLAHGTGIMPGQTDYYPLMITSTRNIGFLGGEIDLTTRIKMTGCSLVDGQNCLYGILIPNTPSNVFIYLDAAGKFAVEQGGDLLQPFTAHRAIKRNDWNVVRVSTAGSNLLLTINGVKVAAVPLEIGIQSGNVNPTLFMTGRNPLAGGTPANAGHLWVDYLRVYHGDVFEVLYR